MGNVYCPLKVPTKDQSPISKTFKSWLPNADTMIFTPGYTAGVPNVYRLLLIHEWFRADANVGNRTILPTIGLVVGEGGSGSVVFRATTGNITASQACRIVIAQYDINTLSGLTLDFQADVECAFQLGEMYLSGDDRITMVHSGTFGGDQADVKIVAEYLNHKLGITGIE